VAVEKGVTRLACIQVLFSSPPPPPPPSLSSHRRPRPAPSFASTAVASAALLAEVVRRVQAATVAVGAVAVMPAAVAVLRSRV
jgi:CO/xanthine dehydrogenase FAD-binding subunit